MKVYKYPMDTNGLPLICEAPDASYIVHAGLDPSGRPCIWALVEEGQFPQARIVSVIVGTGHPVPDAHPDLVHIASWTEGPFVWHAFGAIIYETEEEYGQT